MSKIISCTMYFNEEDLLDLKIAEEINKVDKLIIVESNQTFMGNPKKLFLKDNPKYKHPKIDLLFLEDEFDVINDKMTIEEKRRIGFENETKQRNRAQEFIEEQIENDDVIIVTDLDEIICEDDFEEIVACTYESHEKYGRHIKLNMDLYMHKINLLVDVMGGKIWYGAFAVQGELINNFENVVNRKMSQQGRSLDVFFKPTFNLLRNCSVETTPCLPIKGKHFSYLGDVQKIVNKFQNYSHAEFAHTSEEDVKKRIENLELITGDIDNNNQPFKLKPVEIDKNYPKTILNNFEKWQKHIY